MNRIICVELYNHIQKLRPEWHDTDEAHAAGIAFSTNGEVVINKTCDEADIVAKKNMELNGMKP